MKLERDPIDSELLGFGVYNVTDFSLSDDLVTALEKIHERDFYVVCKVPSHRIAEIHFLEGHGFRFSELQLQLRCKISHIPNVPRQFRFVRAADNDLPVLLEIVEEGFSDDRMRRDPLLSTTTALRRYRGYIERALSEKNQRLYKTVLNNTNEVVGFKSHRIDSEGEATLLLGAIAKKFRGTGAAAANSLLELAQLRSDGVFVVKTHVSATNTNVINLELKQLKFHIEASTVVMRLARFY